MHGYCLLLYPWSQRSAIISTSKSNSSISYNNSHSNNRISSSSRFGLETLRPHFEANFEASMQHAIAAALGDVERLPDGGIIGWNTFGSKRTRGLGDYLLSTGQWKLIIQLGTIKKDLKFDLGDLEIAMAKVPVAENRGNKKYKSVNNKT